MAMTGLVNPRTAAVRTQSDARTRTARPRARTADHIGRSDSRGITIRRHDDFSRRTACTL
jgi:hypothetical protein